MIKKRHPGVDIKLYIAALHIKKNVIENAARNLFKVRWGSNLLVGDKNEILFVWLPPHNLSGDLHVVAAG